MVNKFKWFLMVSLLHYYMYYHMLQTLLLQLLKVTLEMFCQRDDVLLTISSSFPIAFRECYNILQGLAECRGCLC